MECLLAQKESLGPGAHAGGSESGDATPCLCLGQPALAAAAAAAAAKDQDQGRHHTSKSATRPAASGQRPAASPGTQVVKKGSKGNDMPPPLDPGGGCGFIALTRRGPRHRPTICGPPSGTHKLVPQQA
ncbi:hypothetical protein LX36DRAFT_206281 [Colletotrichum falcatum]|nr:hypothetical protein LX36DRAFT_206281 [Colletotrichum falcatum]